MREARSIVVVGVATLALLTTAPGCATLGEQSLSETVDDCGQGCTTCAALILLSPCIIAASAGFAAGACTRCAEGPAPSDPPEEAQTASLTEVPLEPSARAMPDARMEF